MGDILIAKRGVHTNKFSKLNNYIGLEGSKG